MKRSTEETTQAASGHPKGLYVLFFAELWERFSFYGMRALLTLYMSTPVAGTAAYAAYRRAQIGAGQRPDPPGLGYSRPAAASIYHAYGALVYAFPVVGGRLADRLLGYRVAIILGGLLMAAGHFVMAFQHPLFLFSALALISLGNGFFKPNISSLVGRLYGPGDPRRESGFTIFYMGINLGALLAPLVCGTLGQRLSWHLGFGAAGVGMLIGLLCFVYGRSLLEGHGEPPPSANLNAPWIAGQSRLTVVAVCAILVAPLTAFVLWRNAFVGYLLYAFGILTLVYIGYLAKCGERKTRRRLALIVVLMWFHTLFWAVFEQAGSSFTFLTDKFVDRRVINVEIPTSLFQVFNPTFIVALAPVFARLWRVLHRRGLNPSVPAKFALGDLGAAAGFGALVLGCQSAVPNAVGVPKFGLAWMVLAYLLHTLGELCLSPVGLSAVTELSPPQSVGAMMGAWFLTFSFGHKLAALIATRISAGDPAKVLSSTGIGRYRDVYGSVGLAVAGQGIILGLLSRWLRRLM